MSYNYGSMAGAKGAEKMKKTIVRSSVISDARSFTTSQITQPGQSLFASGTFANLSFSGGLSDFYDSSSGIFLKFDQFRFKSFEVFLCTDKQSGTTLVDPNLVIFSSVDQDDALPTSWEEFRTRKNIALTSTNASQNLVKLGKFKPNANYAVSTVSSGPQNVVPGPDQWMDSAALDQQFLGIKVQVSCQSGVPVRFSIFVKAMLEFKAQR